MVYSAAIYNKKTGQIHSGNKLRHSEILCSMDIENLNEEDLIFGFRTSKGFLNRKAAAVFALECGQLQSVHLGNELTSEDLY